MSPPCLPYSSSEPFPPERRSSPGPPTRTSSPSAVDDVVAAAEEMVVAVE
jgi:hypothetical protein